MADGVVVHLVAFCLSVGTTIGVHAPDFKKRKRRKIFQPRKWVFPLRITGGTACVTKRTNSGRSGATPKSST